MKKILCLLVSIVMSHHCTLSAPNERNRDVEMYFTGTLGFVGTGIEKQVDYSYSGWVGIAAQLYVAPHVSLGMEYGYGSMLLCKEGSGELRWLLIIPFREFPGWSETVTGSSVTPTITFRSSTTSTVAIDLTGGYGIRFFDAKNTRLSNTLHLTFALRIQPESSFRMRFAFGAMNGSIGTAIHLGFAI